MTSPFLTVCDANYKVLTVSKRLTACAIHLSRRSGTRQEFRLPLRKS